MVALGPRTQCARSDERGNGEEGRRVGRAVWRREEWMGGGGGGGAGGGAGGGGGEALGCPSPPLGLPVGGPTPSKRTREPFSSHHSHSRSVRSSAFAFAFECKIDPALFLPCFGPRQCTVFGIGLGLGWMLDPRAAIEIPFRRFQNMFVLHYFGGAEAAERAALFPSPASARSTQPRAPRPDAAAATATAPAPGAPRAGSAERKERGPRRDRRAAARVRARQRSRSLKGGREEGKGGWGGAGKDVPGGSHGTHR